MKNTRNILNTQKIFIMDQQELVVKINSIFNSFLDVKKIIKKELPSKKFINVKPSINKKSYE